MPRNLLAGGWQEAQDWHDCSEKLRIPMYIAATHVGIDGPRTP